MKKNQQNIVKTFMDLTKLSITDTASALGVCSVTANNYLNNESPMRMRSLCKMMDHLEKNNIVAVLKFNSKSKRVELN